jgi:hypothetical protein
MRWMATALLVLALITQALGVASAQAAFSADPPPRVACHCCDCGGEACCAAPTRPVPPSPPLPPARAHSDELALSLAVLTSLGALKPLVSLDPPLPPLPRCVAVLPVFVRLCCLLI